MPMYQSTGQPAHQSVDQLADQRVYPPAHRSAGQSMHQPAPLQMHRPGPARWLTCAPISWYIYNYPRPYIAMSAISGDQPNGIRLALMEQQRPHAASPPSHDPAATMPAASIHYALATSTPTYGLTPLSKMSNLLVNSAISPATIC